MEIYNNHCGVSVLAVSSTTDTKNVDGHLYCVKAGPVTSKIEFQQGAVHVNGVNGLTNEALLAILIHRTKHLDSQFGCDENKRAIQHMEEALVNLEVRTFRRMVRGVEGKNIV